MQVTIQGTIDAIICGENGHERVLSLCQEMDRVLKPNGCLLIVSCNPDLLSILNQIPNWQANVRHVTRAIDVDSKNCPVCGEQSYHKDEQQATVGSAKSDVDSDTNGPIVEKGECRLCAARKRVRRTYFVYNVCKGVISAP